MRPRDRFVAAAAAGILLATGAVAPAPAQRRPEPPRGLDHFKCYATSKTAFAERPAGVADQFGSRETRVTSLQLVCTPVRRDSAKIRRPLAHLTCYATTDVEQNFKQRRVQVSNRFGVRQLAVTAPASLCVPALTRRAPATPPTRPNPATLVDHFRCYDVGPLATPRSVTLRDQFATTRSRVIQAVGICNPVSQDRSRVRRPGAHLVCYSIKDAQAFEPLAVAVRDRFALTGVRLRAPRTLCLPSFVQKPA